MIKNSPHQSLTLYISNFDTHFFVGSIFFFTFAFVLKPRLKQLQKYAKKLNMQEIF